MMSEREEKKNRLKLMVRVAAEDACKCIDSLDDDKPIAIDYHEIGGDMSVKIKCDAEENTTLAITGGTQKPK